MISLPAQSQITEKRSWLWLPGLSILALVMLSLLTINSAWIQGKILDIHKDPFTIERSMNALATARIVIPLGLAAALLAYLAGRRFLCEAAQAKLAIAPQRLDQFFSALALVSTLCALFRLLQCPLGGDDSYIDYRYVLRWLDGQFDYNTGERVMGFTSHLHLLALWLLCLVCRTREVDLVSYYLNCAADQITTVLLFALVWAVYRRFLPAFVAALLYATNVYSCQEVVAGKETALVTLTMLLAMLALQLGKFKWLPWCANALFWLRPEGAMSTLVLLFTGYQKEGKNIIKSALVPCALSAALLLFLYLYFGTILPHGMIAKAKAHQPVQLLPTLKLPLDAIGSEISNATLSPILGSFNWTYAGLTVLACAACLVFFKAEPWKLYRNLVLAQLAFLLATRPAYFGWYFCWFTLLGPILIAVAINFVQANPLAWTKLPRCAAAAILGLHVVAYTIIGTLWAPYNWLWTLERVKVYREVALYMIQRTGGQIPIAAADVGMLGYSYPGHITDVMGLVSDESLKYYPLKTKYGVWPYIKYLIPPAAIAGMKPTYLIAAASIVDELLLDDPQFKQDYVEIKRWENPNMVGKVVYIFERKAAADAPGGPEK